MNMAVAHVMTSNVFLASVDHSIQRVRELMAEKRIHAVPVVGKDRKILGIVTTADLAKQLDDVEPVSSVMSDVVATISATNLISDAARLMRARRIHHLVVTDGDKVIGMLSSFDLLKVLEGLRR